MEESTDMVYMDTNVPSKHLVNDPIEIEKEEEKPTQGAPNNKSKGKKLLETILKGRNVGNIS